jgi:dTDP-4-dehydrorhamnose reductase
MSIALLGSSGMLGSAIVDYFKSIEVPIIEVNRDSNPAHHDNSHIVFDISSQNANDLIEQLPSDSFLINASGVIKHKINDNNMKDITDSIRINTIFPHQLVESSKKKNIRILQIATDCVFSGNRGNYSENENHDPTDIYGVTKSLGEVVDMNIMILRCSIIGVEKRSKIEFLNWVIDQPLNAKLDGYSDHLWNGLTTLHFAKMLNGIITKNLFSAGTQHIVPQDYVSKYELIKMVANEFGRDDLLIESTASQNAVDRRLVTLSEVENQKLWNSAGYDQPIRISEMLSEYANWVKNF